MARAPATPVVDRSGSVARTTRARGSRATRPCAELRTPPSPGRGVKSFCFTYLRARSPTTLRSERNEVFAVSVLSAGLETHLTRAGFHSVGLHDRPGGIDA